MNELLRNPKDITAWLDRYGIKNYKLIPDDKHGHVVDVAGYVDLSYKNLFSIDVKFNKIKGSFNCPYNQITSLRGCPKKVSGYFDCSDNELKSLDGSPRIIGEDFIVDRNQLTSLLGSPAQIKGNFSCSENRLTSLAHCPQITKKFWCDGNQLIDLLHCPQKVEGEFYCDNNPNLGDVQEIEDFDTIFQIHLALKNIKQEKEKLSNLIKPSATQLKNLHKI